MNKQITKHNKKKVAWYSYVALFCTIVFLSGLLGNIAGPLSAFDFNNALGDFGNLGSLTDGSGKLAANFKGSGGSGAKDAFLLALTIAPAIIAAFAVVEVCNEYKGLQAAEKFFSPILKPLLSLPGSSAIALVASFTSSDAGAALTKSLHDDKYIKEKERLILTVFQFSSPALLVNFFAIGSAALIMYIGNDKINIAFLVILIFKFFGAALCRLYLFTKRNNN